MVSREPLTKVTVVAFCCLRCVSRGDSDAADSTCGREPVQMSVPDTANSSCALEPVQKAAPGAVFSTRRERVPAPARRTGCRGPRGSS
eukprot:156132-Rhodomonas_salina.1